MDGSLRDRDFGRGSVLVCDTCVSCLINPFPAYVSYRIRGRVFVYSSLPRPEFHVSRSTGPTYEIDEAIPSRWDRETEAERVPSASPCRSRRLLGAYVGL